MTEWWHAAFEGFQLLTSVFIYACWMFDHRNQARLNKMLMESLKAIQQIDFEAIRNSVRQEVHEALDREIKGDVPPEPPLFKSAPYQK